MKATIEPYLNFDGQCEDALEFYRESLGAEILMLMRFKDSPEPLPPEMVPEGYDEKIMHATFTIGGNTIMACDGGCGGEAPKFSGFSLSISVDDDAEAKRIFEALAPGGEITMPLGKTFWSPCFGLLTDQYGLSWMVSVTSEEDRAKQQTGPSKNPVGWFELYVEDMERARAFYESTFQVSLEHLESPDLEMWGFPCQPEVAGSGGALAKMEGCAPGGGGTIVYFSCLDCATESKRAVESGGKIFREKFSIGQYGYIALVEDSEGNMIGLHSMV